MHESIFVEAEAELITLRDFLRWGVSYFTAAKLHYGHGTDNAWDDALHLVLFALHLPFDIEPDLLDATLTSSERRYILKLFRKRIIEKIPVPYITNTAWFSKMPFYVDNRVLIPRSPIAELIEHQFQPWIDTHQVKNILDLGTGSGCIAIISALHFPEAQVDASDISTDALAVAAKNVEEYDLKHQVNLIQSDVFSNLKNKRYDIIVSNPPYVGQEELQTLPAEYRHEPQQALAGGGNVGLNIVKRILCEAKDHLTPHGILIIEVGNSEDALKELYPDAPFTWLEFERGEDGVFLLTTDQLHHFHEYFAKNEHTTH